ncbi:hypothetical protein B0O99DRAFT_685744 [Bisporella sp. PMI_857]|nr:hypothetical protein B0O99DRAFT_685744 [Bisporella sp. PMI_857]
MPPPIVISTVQAAILSAISNVFGQMIAQYKNNVALSIDPVPVLHFILLRFLNGPPQFLWQQTLEFYFPSKTRGHAKITATKRKGSAEPAGELRTDWGNTFKKYLLDQTIGNVLNSFMYIVIMASLQTRSADQVWEMTVRGMAPMMRARMKFWPIAAFVSFALVSPARRVLFNNLVGMTWGIILSLM